MEKATHPHSLDWKKDSKGWEESGERDQRESVSRKDHPPHPDW